MSGASGVHFGYVDRDVSTCIAVGVAAKTSSRTKAKGVLLFGLDPRHLCQEALVFASRMAVQQREELPFILFHRHQYTFELTERETIVNLPASYIEVLQMMPVDEISFGGGGVKLFRLAELEQGQIGYGVAIDGTSLCSHENGAWKPNWIVIGYDTACGDPLFIDTDDPALPVLTAMHGMGVWEPLPVSISTKVFARSLEDLAQISAGRRNPVELGKNPLSDNERRAFLQHIAELNQNKLEPEFWQVLLGG